MLFLPFATSLKRTTAQPRLLAPVGAKLASLYATRSRTILPLAWFPTRAGGWPCPSPSLAGDPDLRSPWKGVDLSHPPPWRGPPQALRILAWCCLLWKRAFLSTSCLGCLVAFLKPPVLFCSLARGEGSPQSKSTSLWQGEARPLKQCMQLGTRWQSWRPPGPSSAPGLEEATPSISQPCNQLAAPSVGGSPSTW